MSDSRSRAEDARTSSTHPKTKIEIPPEDHTWELDVAEGHVDRLKVPGGWIYCFTDAHRHENGYVYVPSPGAHR